MSSPLSTLHGEFLGAGRQRRTRRSSGFGDADDVFIPDVQLNGDHDDDDDDDDSSTWSLISEQPSQTSRDSGTPYDARSDLRGSDARLSAASSRGSEQRRWRKNEVSRKRRRQVNGIWSPNYDDQAYRPKRYVRHRGLFLFLLLLLLLLLWCLIGLFFAEFTPV